MTDFSAQHKPIGFYREMLEKPHLLVKIEAVEQLLKNQPNACVQLGDKKSRVHVRNGNSPRQWVSMRSLYWAYAKRPDEMPTFGPTACKTPGCINPAHQTLSVNFNIRTGSTLRDAPAHPFGIRVITKDEQHAQSA